MKWRWPFHKESVVGSFGWHTVMCLAIVVSPTFHAVYLIAQH